MRCAYNLNEACNTSCAAFGNQDFQGETPDKAIVFVDYCLRGNFIIQGAKQ